MSYAIWNITYHQGPNEGETNKLWLHKQLVHWQRQGGSSDRHSLLVMETMYWHREECSKHLSSAAGQGMQMGSNIWCYLACTLFCY